MRKILAFALAVIFVLSFASCGKSGKETESTKPGESETQSDVKEAGFREATEEIAICASLGLRFLDTGDYLDSASCMQDILGWYCARQALAGGKDYLTEKQEVAIQRALRPGKEVFDLMVSVNDGVVADASGGEDVIYRFPLYVENYENYFSSLVFTAEYPDGYEGVLSDDTDRDASMIKVNIYDKENEYGEDYGFLFVKSENASPLNPYVVEEIVLPEVKGAEYSSDFRTEDLIDANKLPGLLDEYKSVKVTKSSNYSGYAAECYYYRWNGHIISNGLYEMDGEKEYTFTYDDYMLGYSDAHYVMEYPVVEDKSFDSENIIAYYFNTGKIINVQEKGDNYSFDVISFYEDEDSYTLRDSYEVKKSDLSIQKVVWNAGSEYESTCEFTYGGEIDTYGLTDGWDDHPMRHVTVICSITDENGPADGILPVETPFNVEVKPFSYGDYTLYNNAEMTIPYKYPGDGADYSVYYTNAMG